MEFILSILILKGGNYFMDHPQSFEELKANTAIYDKLFPKDKPKDAKVIDLQNIGFFSDAIAEKMKLEEFAKNLVFKWKHISIGDSILFLIAVYRLTMAEATQLIYSLQHGD